MPSSGNVLKDDINSPLEDLGGDKIFLGKLDIGGIRGSRVVIGGRADTALKFCGLVLDNRIDECLKAVIFGANRREHLALEAEAFGSDNIVFGNFRHGALKRIAHGA